MPIVDYYSRHRVVKFLKYKSEASSEFIKYNTAMERLTNHEIAVVCLDNAPELVEGEFRRHCEAEGIVFEKTVPDVSQQNGVVERSNGLLASMGRAVLIDANLSDFFWPLAIQAACHMLNRLHTSGLPAGITPHHLWWGKPPDLSHLRVFGTRVAACGEVGRFVGYATDAKGYLIWFPNTRSVQARRDVAFVEPFDDPAPVPAGTSSIWDDVFTELERRFLDASESTSPVPAVLAPVFSVECVPSSRLHVASTFTRLCLTVPFVLRL